MIQQCLKAIEDNNLVYIEEIVSFMPFGKNSFYNHKLNEVNEIKKAIEETKVKTKQQLRSKWFDSKSPALQIALYRLLATEKEYERLTIQRIDHTSGGDKINPINITVASKETTGKIDKLINESMLN